MIWFYNKNGFVFTIETNRIIMNSSLSGKRYETVIAELLKIVSTAGSNKNINDLRLSWQDRFVDIEAKQTIKAEFGQRRAELIDGVLSIPHPLFQDCIAHAELFEGKIPPFLLKKDMTFPEWDEESSDFSDEQYHAPSDVISKYYLEKGNSYIQINGYGLYHTGEDVCNFGVPYFRCPTYLRIRCKRHGKKCAVTGKDIPTSVMASFWISKPPAKSPFSLDEPAKLPEVLRSHLTL
jgi:hypothetical protein